MIGIHPDCRHERSCLCFCERQVVEETGVKAQFQSVLMFRQMHRRLFGVSDM